MPGPPPKPTALKVLEGNRGKRPLNEAEPKPADLVVIPQMIQDDPVLLREWNRHAPRLSKLGLLKEIDDDALATLCVLTVAFRQMVKDEAKVSGLAFLSKELRAMWSRFGMTPADRSRVKVDKAKDESKLARFRSGA